MRTATLERKTKETDIAIEVNLDGSGVYDVATGIGFLDHMMEQLSRHSLIDITLKIDGDLHVDQHHTVEDGALALGQAISDALDDRKGITRFAATLIPMDETLSRVAVDLSNRPFLVWRVELTRPEIGGMDTELFKHWFESFAQTLGANIHVETLYGENNHHMIESCFKALARSLRRAVEIDPRKSGEVPSTKGRL